MARPELKQMLAERSFVGAPGVFDMISAKVADQTDASALYVNRIRACRLASRAARCRPRDLYRHA